MAPVAVTEGAPSVAPIDEAEARRRALEALKADVRAVCGGWLAQLRVLGVASDALSDVLDPTLGLVAAVEAAIVGGPTEAIVAAWVSIEGRGTIGGGEISSDLDQGSTSSGHTDQRDGGLGEEREPRARHDAAGRWIGPKPSKRERDVEDVIAQCQALAHAAGHTHLDFNAPDPLNFGLRKKLRDRLKGTKSTPGYSPEDLVLVYRYQLNNGFHQHIKKIHPSHCWGPKVIGGLLPDARENPEGRPYTPPGQRRNEPFPSDLHCDDEYCHPDGRRMTPDELASGMPTLAQMKRQRAGLAPRPLVGAYPNPFWEKSHNGGGWQGGYDG